MWTPFFWGSNSNKLFEVGPGKVLQRQGLPFSCCFYGAASEDAWDGEREVETKAWGRSQRGVQGLLDTFPVQKASYWDGKEDQLFARGYISCEGASWTLVAVYWGGSEPGLPAPSTICFGLSLWSSQGSICYTIGKLVRILCWLPWDQAQSLPSY